MPRTARKVSILVPEGASWITGVTARASALVQRLPLRPSSLLELPAWGATALVVAIPMGALVVGSIATGDAAATAPYLDVFRDPVTRRALLNTLRLAAFTVVVAAAIGIPLALIVSPVRGRAGSVLRWGLAVPGLMPPLASVLALTVTGVVDSEPSGSGSSLAGASGVVLAQSYSLYLVFYVAMLLGLDRLDPAQREAAHTLGAGRRRVFRTVVLPAVRPFLVGACLFAFLGALGSFAAPYLVVDAPPVMTTEIATHWITGASAEAMAEALVLLLIGVAAYLICWPVLAAGLRGGRAPGPGRPPLTPGAGRRALSWGLAGLLIAPVVVLLVASLSAGDGWGEEGGPVGLALEHYTGLVGDPEITAPLANILWTGLLAFGIALAVGGVVSAWLVFGTPLRRRRNLATLALLTVALPGTSAAMAVLATPLLVGGAVGAPTMTVTAWGVALGWTIRLFPVVVWLGMRIEPSVDPSFADAARVSGETRGRMVRRVYLPRILPAIGLAGAAAAAICAGEVAAAFLLHNHPGRPISIELLERIADGRLESAAAIGVLLTAVSVLSAVIMVRDPVPGRPSLDSADGRA